MKKDIGRYFVLAQPESFIQKIKIILLTQGIWAIFIYRLGVSLQKKKSILHKFLMVFVTFLQKIIEITTGISIGFSCRIGQGLYIGHFGGIFIHKDVSMGEFCNISQGVVIGLGGRGDKMGVPTIGDRVYIGPHVVILGKITIGNNVAIGANAVVTKDLPDNAVAVGVPAKIINYNGSADFIVLNN